MKHMQDVISWVTDRDWIGAMPIMCLVFMAIIGVVGCICIICAEEEPVVVEAIKYCELDTGETLFATDDGNLYKFHVNFEVQNGSRFLIKLRFNNPDNPNDDELLELWVAPSA